MENFNSNQFSFNKGKQSLESLESQDYQHLNQIINSNNQSQLTPWLFDLLSEINHPINGDINNVISLQHFVQFIETAGWIEHTSDWDLGMIWELKDDEFNTGHGYWVFDIEGDNVKLEIEDNEDSKTVMIPIKDIVNAKFYR